MAKLQSILVVDDNERCMEFISLALEAEGKVQVHKETVSRKVVERVREHNPGLVLLDIKMPELDGFDVLQQLRSEGEIMPVVMLSGSLRAADINRAFSLGCSGYVPKPSSLAEYRALAGAIVSFWSRGETPECGARPG